jgi:hypothetical protein
MRLRVVRVVRVAFAISSLTVALACSSSPKAGAPAQPTRQARAPSETLAASFHQIARGAHANFVAGPIKAQSGIYAAYSDVPSGSAVHRTPDRTVILKWKRGSWMPVATLRSEHDPAQRGTKYYRMYWNFPEQTLTTVKIAGADRRAPVFAGAVNGAYPVVFMVAAMSRDGHWAWRDFLSCDPRLCNTTSRGTDVVANLRVRHGRILSVVKPCIPCQGKTTRTVWRWSPRLDAFVR